MQFCGWHTRGTISGRAIKHSVVGNAARYLNARAQQNRSPNGNAGADGMASIVGCEAEEGATDLDLHAWCDMQGYETVDERA